MTEATLVLTTLPEGFDVPAWGRQLVEARLAACVSALPPMTSVYRWRDETGRDAIEQATEQQVVIKTTVARLEDVKVWFAANHPYDVPELLALPVADGGGAYLAWLGTSV